MKLNSHMPYLVEEGLPDRARCTIAVLIMAAMKARPGTGSQHVHTCSSDTKNTMLLCRARQQDDMLEQTMEPVS